MSSDQSNAVVFNQEGQPGNPSNQEGTETAQPKYLTLEEAQRLAQEAEEKAYRRAQGLVAKSRSGIETKVQTALKSLDGYLAQLKEVGIELSPEQASYLKQAQMERAFTAPSESPQPTENPPVQASVQQQEGAPDPVTADAWRMMQEAGVIIEPTDVEAKKLDNSSPYKFLQSVEAAIKAKKSRLSTGEEPPTVPTPPKTPTNLGGAGGQTASVEALTARLMELQKAPSKNMKEITEVTAQLEKLM